MLLRRLLEFAWVGLIAFWLVTAFFASRAVRRQSWWSRVLTILWGVVRAVPAA